MGRNEFQRTITTTVIKAVELSFKDGKVVTTPVADITVTGNVTDEEKALVLVKKANGKNKQYGIVSMTKTEAVYTLSLEDFLKYATKETPAKDGDKKDVPPETK